MPRFARLSILLPLAALLAGCSTASHVTSLAPQTATSGLHGSLHGGQQPIVGATIQLYAVGTTGDGSASTPLLTPAILTDATGSFDLTNKFTCPQATTLVYIVATGGNPGLPPPFNNPASTLISALGPCGNPNNINFISLNEVSTVAAVYALASFMSSPTAIGSGASDAQALADAFTLAMELVNPVTGTSPGASVPPGTTIPVAQINTLANLISACVNSSGGTAGDSSICGQIFSLTQGTGTAPTDTTTALLHLALNPSLNTQALYDLVLPTAPFQPSLTQQPPDFGVRPTVPSDFTVSPGSLNFGSIFVGGTTASQTVTISNNTTHALSINSYQILGPDAADFAFTIPQPNTCPSITISTTILPGDACQVSIGFTPSAAGARHAYFIIHNTSPNPFIAIPITGVGTAGTVTGPITAAPSQVTFFYYSAPQPVTLTNNGNTPLSISGITFSPNIGLFTQTNDCGSVLQGQSICTIYVAIHAIGVSGNAVMTIADDAAAGPQTVPINFSGNPFTFVDAIDFGRISVGKTVGGVVSYTTPQSGLNNQQSFMLSGGNAADVSFQSPPDHVFDYYCTISPSCLANLFVTPSILGPESTTFTVYDSAVGMSADVPVRFTGVGNGPYFVARLQNSPNVPPPVSVVNLNGTIGNASTTTFTIQYTGTETPIVPVPVVVGPHASEFTGTSNCNGDPAYPFCTITLTYTPTNIEGFTVNTAFVESTNAVQQAFTINASATGGGLTVSPGQLTFPGTLAGTLSSPQSVTVTALTNNAVNATVNGAFQISSGSSCTATPCQVSVAFAPSAGASPGTTTGSLNLVDPLTGNRATVYLIGTTTVQTTASVSPGSLTFPSRVINSTSIPQTITVTNTGSTNVLTFTSVSLTGANPGDYILTNNCTSNVIPGNSCTINVSFAPTATGTRAANVSIVSNSTTSPDVVTLSGTGSTPP